MRNDPNETQRIEHRLRAERPMYAAPDDLADRVMANLPGRISGVRRERMVIWPRFAIAFGVVAVAMLLFRFYPDRSGTGTGTGVNVASNTGIAPEPLKIELPQLPAERVRLLAAQLDQSLEKELENVISDTRQAIRFVASNFLPEK